MNLIEKDTVDFSKNILLELVELKKLGISVPPKAFEFAQDLDPSSDYYVGQYTSMKPSECADLMIELAS